MYKRQDQTQAAAKVNAGQVGFVARAQNTQWMGAAAENYVQCPVLEGPCLLYTSRCV